MEGWRSLWRLQLFYTDLAVNENGQQAIWESLFLCVCSNNTHSCRFYQHVVLRHLRFTGWWRPELKLCAIFQSALFGVNHMSQFTEGDNVCQGQRQAERIIKRAFNGPFWCYLSTLMDRTREEERDGERERERGRTVEILVQCTKTVHFVWQCNTREIEPWKPRDVCGFT